MTLGGKKLIIKLKKILDSDNQCLLIDENLEDFSYKDFQISNINVKGEVFKQSDILQLSCKILFTYFTTFDRCLEDIQKNEDFPLEKQYDIKEIENSEAEGIDLKEAVREQILLNMPNKVLCKDDCLGLCPDCGINLNKESCDCGKNKINPKFAALSKLLEGEGEN